jgi:hypothetical protein
MFFIKVHTRLVYMLLSGLVAVIVRVAVVGVGHAYTPMEGGLEREHVIVSVFDAIVYQVEPETGSNATFVVQGLQWGFLTFFTVAGGATGQALSALASR